MFPAPPAKRRAESRILAQVAPKVLRHLLLAAAAALAAAAPGRAQESQVEAAPPRYTVAIEAPAPLDALLEDNLDLMRYRDNARIDRAQLQRLVRAAPEQVKTLLATAGFYSPEVSVRLDAAAPAVLVRVAPGEPVRVGGVELVLRGFDAAGAALEAGWSLRQGQVFRQADWELAKRNLLRQAMQTRYPRARLLETLATVDPASRRADLRVLLDSGPELRFGALRIEGLRRYPAAIVHNLNRIRPGDYYDEAALQALQARLQDSGYFSSVEVGAELGGEDDAAAPGAAPLLVRVTENKAKNVSAGLGYSTNTGNRAQLNYDDLSVFGLKLKSALTLETKRQSAHADLYFPTSADGYNDSIGTSFERNDIASEITSVAGIAARRSWGTPRLERSFSLEYLSERKTVQGVDADHSKSLPLTYGVTWRRLDDLLFPTRGHVLRAQLGGAPLPLLTDQPFVRASARLVYYHPLGARANLILRGEGGALGSREKAGVPAVFLFRAGGDQSVRGYAYQELGVHEGSATVGARYLATASAEAQYWFMPAWGGAVFYDAGNAADTLATLRPKVGYGAGVRYRSPVGPINVDAAYGRALRQYRLHFSLGFTF